MISEETYTVLHTLIKSGVLPSTIPTKKVVALLNNKEYHRAKLYQPEYKKLLGARRKGIGLHIEFDTLKVIDFMLKSEGTIIFNS